MEAKIKQVLQTNYPNRILHPAKNLIYKHKC
ncbi:hypothetical protein CF65_01251 [Aggregatibacter actinomycetemcomitans HK1651]|nr:hypothetical protein CF65_01251 [Aggregatibacter actinomycetemcomitans HK1651]